MFRKGVILTMSLFFLTQNPFLYGASGFDHQYSLWNRFLDQYAGEGRVNYSELKANQVALLDAYQEMGKVTKAEYESWTKNQKIAFWLNAYNVGAILSVVQFYPLKKGLSWKALAFPENSIQQIPDVWDRPVFVMLGEKTSLGGIEHEILRKQFKEPRIHFALVCASIGCPVLREEPYSAELLDQQLDDQVRQFLTTPEKFRYDKTKNILYLSPIFKWFRKDFEQTGGIVQFIKKYVPESIVGAISGNSKIEWLSYDWSLNERVGKS
ncbi:MAG: hypothetical protein A3A81_03885 [Omnitrophica bacterium RIFCSPLOWO2_01_FULL_45_10b]|nr:MAG: hypothetical protein A3A81_03885 [Omnitrophica bacterium RIFCSPLOWO2_01_FULL_45_10b]